MGQEGGGDKAEAEEESTVKLILYAILDCIAVIVRSFLAVVRFFWRMLRGCCYPVKENLTRCIDRWKEWQSPYLAKKPASGVPQFSINGPSYGTA